MDKYIGKRLDGRYEIHELLGVGGMAYVYKAYDNIEKRWVAIKILKEELAGNSDFLRRFRNESKAIAVLSHPNIVKVYDVSFGDRIQYIVMEYIDGITLKQYIEQQGEIKWREALYFTVQILRALQHAHEKGIIHRDIKPQNIMLLEDGTIKVTDFGIARFSQAETQTMTDKAIGSVHYIAPEQARGGYINDKADIYSVGVMLYEMLTGQLPFVADNAVSVAIMQMQAEPTPPSRINPSIPKGLEEITMHAMEKNPAQRFPSAADMLEDVERFRRNPEIVFHYDEQVDRAYAGTSADIYGNVQQNAAPQKYNDNYEYEEEYVRSQNGARASNIIKGIVAAVIVVALVAGGIFGWRYLQNLTTSTNKTSDEIVLPNFVGMIYDTDIKDNPDYADFTFEITYGNVPSKQPGEVLRQTPAAGINVKKGKTVSLTVNGEAEQVVVEDVKGYKQQDAYDALKALNLSPKIQAVADDDTAVGYVVKTDPAAGSTVSTGTTVIIYVSGPSTVVIPNIVGYQYSTAKEELEAAGFVVTAEYDDESDKDENTVLSVSPNEGEKAKKGSVVTVTVSSGKGAQKDVYYDIPLPGGVSDDLTMKIYVDGTLIETRTVNPSTSPYSNMTFTGKDRANLVITLNDQQYITAEIDYTTQSINVTSQQSYATPEPEPTPTPDNGGDMSESDGSVTAHED
ncbi:Stk1 family PASTA domain-containing Ser/Thr kinase [Ruminococcus bromii]|uniref:Stk1 family PASTA domain-containing Ser/Thr kinase n=1 Tax=Ruminococcus bromii TaxID=40518 RepID=UPI00292F2460|nr:Stk1 family PASTA domain-containing Ser/Thr kinase [Ruminococcus bromii]MDE8726570.1 Stk1 family PASTA domain-containing Ser/Thr kinase [Ruminococcus bromii]